MALAVHPEDVGKLTDILEKKAKFVFAVLGAPGPLFLNFSFVRPPTQGPLPTPEYVHSKKHERFGRLCR